MGRTYRIAARLIASAFAFMHRTRGLDYAVILSGEIT